MTEPRAFVDYYTSKGIIPTRQDISNLDTHFRRRETLYRHLGIPKSLLRRASVIEFGPGSGHNALFPASCRPGRYVLVDATPASLESTRGQLSGSYGRDHIQVVESEILAFRTAEKFDLVLCEGVIPTQKDPVAFLKHVASFAGPGGLVVITSMDPIAVFAEILRRYLTKLMTADITDFQLQIKALVKFFDQDLRTLTGMSRRFEDWVVDILGPVRCFPLHRLLMASLPNLRSMLLHRTFWSIGGGIKRCKAIHSASTKSVRLHTSRKRTIFWITVSSARHGTHL